MPQVINYEDPIFWTPANAVGSAATVNGQINSQPFKINLHWSVMFLATRGNNDIAQLRTEVSVFLQNFIPKDVTAGIILNFQFDGETFRKITDPHWIPGNK